MPDNTLCACHWWPIELCEDQTMTDTKNLKELAEKLAPAYQQPWESHRHSASAVTVGAVGEDGEYSDFIDVRISDYSAFDEHDDELGQWIAAANPQVILGLIAEVEHLRKDAARYRWLRDSCTRQWDVMCRDIEIVINGDGAEDCEDLDGIIDSALEGATQ